MLKGINIKGCHKAGHPFFIDGDYHIYGKIIVSD